MGDPSWSAESPRATRPVRVATASGQTTQFGAPYEMGRALKSRQPYISYQERPEEILVN